MVQSWFQMLFWNKHCDVVSSLPVENAIYNLDLFHSAPVFMGLSWGLVLPIEAKINNSIFLQQPSTDPDFTYGRR